MILGFTGTRNGMTTRQFKMLPLVISSFPERILHGGADGSDTEFHDFLADRGFFDLSLVIEIFPASLEKYHEWIKRTRRQHLSIVHLHEAPLSRNIAMAQRCHHLLATPATEEETPRGGTWHTIRMARLFQKPITIITPKGNILEEDAHNRKTQKTSSN